MAHGACARTRESLSGAGRGNRLPPLRRARPHHRQGMAGTTNRVAPTQHSTPSANRAAQLRSRAHEAPPPVVPDPRSSARGRTWPAGSDPCLFPSLRSRLVGWFFLVGAKNALVDPLFAPPGQRSAASADCMAFAGVASGLHLAALRPTALPSSLTARHRRCGTGMRALEPLMATTTKASLTVRDSGAPLPVLLTVRRWPRDRKPLPE